jgi:UDP-N-acetyl-3-dehydro-alpha-D-glucosamine 3-aminotranferase
MSIPLVDTRAQNEEIKDLLLKVLGEIIRSGRLMNGPKVAEFERDAAEYIGTKHAVAVASGTDALRLALLASGIGRGDEVITSPFTFTATAEAIVQTGAGPVFVDVEEDTFNIDPKLVDAALTDKTKCILPVHLFGYPVKVGPLLEFAVTNGLEFVEDCAHSFGAHYKFTRAGSFGDAGCFSFNPHANLGSLGDGGLVTTDSDGLAEDVRRLRDHGRVDDYRHDTTGFNSRLDEFQAGALCVKLTKIETYNMKRRKLAMMYGEMLAGVQGVVTPREQVGYFHVYHNYTILADDRDRVVKTLAGRDIGSAVMYRVPLHLQRAYSKLGYSKGDFPVSERLAEKALSLPMFPELSGDDVELVCDTIRSCY